MDKKKDLTIFLLVCTARKIFFGVACSTVKHRIVSDRKLGEGLGTRLRVDDNFFNKWTSYNLIKSETACADHNQVKNETMQTTTWLKVKLWSHNLLTHSCGQQHQIFHTELCIQTTCKNSCMDEVAKGAVVIQGCKWLPVVVGGY